MKEELETLVGQMMERGILLDEALTEFKKRFIRRALERARGNNPGRQGVGDSPKYIEPAGGGVQTRSPDQWAGYALGFSFLLFCVN